MNTSFEELLHKKTPTYDSICDIIHEIIKTRKDQGLSQNDLAIKAQVDIIDIMYFEALLLERISLNTLLRILEVFDIKLKLET